ncbi:MAG: NADPH-dependent F420 reductase, partial [Syntrophothermus sp.]
ASNPLDFSRGMPPSLTVCNTDSMGETVQRTFPNARVVKALNTMNAFLMTDPSKVPGNHSLFMAGNDQKAKNEVHDLLKSFGWKEEQFIDTGDITASRGMEMLLPLWAMLMGKFQSPMFNWQVVRG